MRFEEDASESIVFVVPERSPAPNVLYLSSGLAGLAGLAGLGWLNIYRVNVPNGT